MTAAPPTTPERLLTLGECMAAAQVSRATLLRWRYERGLPMVRVGGCVRVRQRDWDHWLAEHLAGDGGNGYGNAPLSRPASPPAHATEALATGTPAAPKGGGQ